MQSFPVSHLALPSCALHTTLEVYLESGTVTTTFVAVSCGAAKEAGGVTRRSYHATYVSYPISPERDGHPTQRGGNADATRQPVANPHHQVQTHTLGSKSPLSLIMISIRLPPTSLMVGTATKGGVMPSEHR